MNKLYFIFALLVFLPFGLWSEEATTDDSSSLPCLKVSSGCRKYIKENKSGAVTSTQQCIDEILQGKEIKGIEIPAASIADCKKVRSQLKTK